MRVIFAAFVLLLFAGLTSAQTITVGPLPNPTVPEEVCMQTVPVHFTQYHCAGLDEARTENVRWYSASYYFGPGDFECLHVSIHPSQSWQLPEECYYTLEGRPLVQTWMQETEIRPLHALASVGSIPGICQWPVPGWCAYVTIYSPCNQYRALCDAIDVNTCFENAGVCYDSTYMYVHVDNLALADIGGDGEYEGIAIDTGRGWHAIRTGCGGIDPAAPGNAIVCPIYHV